MIDKPLSLGGVRSLFSKESVFLGDGDSIPQFRVAALFVDDALDLLFHMEQKGHEGYTESRMGIPVVTQKGFLLAAAYHNSLLLDDLMEQNLKEHYTLRVLR